MRPIMAASPRRWPRCTPSLGSSTKVSFTGKLATALGNDPTLAVLWPKAYPGFERAFLSIVERPAARQST